MILLNNYMKSNKLLVFFIVALLALAVFAPLSSAKSCSKNKNGCCLGDLCEEAGNFFDDLFDGLFDIHLEHHEEKLGGSCDWGCNDNYQQYDYTRTPVSYNYGYNAYDSYDNYYSQRYYSPSRTPSRQIAIQSQYPLWGLRY